MRVRRIIPAVALAAFLLGGCSSNKQLLRQQQMDIESLNGRLNELERALVEQTARAEQLKKDLDAALADFDYKEQLYLEQIESKTIITLPGAVMFGSGSARLTPSGEEILDRIADVISNYEDREVLIEGHTDDVGIASEYRDKYPSNWELSSARAQSVLRHFLSKHGLPGERLAAVGCGEYRPVADNATEEGRAMNRRVVIRLAPMEREKAPESEPVLP